MKKVLKGKRTPDMAKTADLTSKGRDKIKMTKNECFDSACLVKTSSERFDTKLALQIHTWINS